MKIRIQKNRRGYALLLMLLIVIAIGCIIYVAGNPAVFFKKAAKMDSSGEILPWSQEKRLVAKDQTVQMPSPEQPSLANVIGYKSYPKQGNEERGEIVLIIDTDGRVRGNWSGDYREGSDISFTVLAGGFNGNIDPTNLWRDQSGTDPSKLYFIAKGSFILLVDNKKNPASNQRRGEIYVTGWINADYKLTGKIVLTSDKQDYLLFTLDCDRPVRNQDLHLAF